MVSNVVDLMSREQDSHNWLWYRLWYTSCTALGLLNMSQVHDYFQTARLGLFLDLGLNEVHYIHKAY